MTEYLSNKIRAFHTVGIFLVLLMHVCFSGTPFFNDFRSHFVALGRSFNPMYFAISGYLFFYSLRITPPHTGVQSDNNKTKKKN